MRKIKALIFDFDGLIIDTEMPRYIAWKETYQKYYCELNITEYATIVGSDDSGFDFVKDLEQKSGGKIDWETVNRERGKRREELLDVEKTLPGVRDYVLKGKALGFKIALASSSPRGWIDRMLPRTGLSNYFDCITTIEETGRAKPDPALFNLAIDKLAVKPQEAIVFEDSPNGCKAAVRAGIFCVVVPNRITKHLRFESPNLVIESMTRAGLEDIIKEAEEEIA